MHIHLSISLLSLFLFLSFFFSESMYLLIYSLFLYRSTYSLNCLIICLFIRAFMIYALIYFYLFIFNFIHSFITKGELLQSLGHFFFLPYFISKAGGLVSLSFEGGGGWGLAFTSSLLHLLLLFSCCITDRSSTLA